MLNEARYSWEHTLYGLVLYLPASTPGQERTCLFLVFQHLGDIRSSSSPNLLGRERWLRGAVNKKVQYVSYHTWVGSNLAMNIQLDSCRSGFRGLPGCLEEDGRACLSSSAGGHPQDCLSKLTESHQVSMAFSEVCWRGPVLVSQT